MAIRLVVNISKKIPIPGLDYSSQTASCSIEAECQSADPVGEAAALYLQAEAAVNHQLGLRGSGRVVSANPAPVTSPNSRPGDGRHQPVSAHRSRHQANGQGRTGRRSPPPCSASQLRLLRRLLEGRDGQLPAILHHYQVGDLEDLDIAQASELIDQLKGQEAGA